MRSEIFRFMRLPLAASFMSAAAMLIDSRSTALAADDDLTLEVDRVGSNTLNKQQIDLQFLLKDVKNGFFAGSINVGCNLQKQNMSIVVALIKPYSVFDGNRDGDQMFFDFGKDSLPALFMRLAKAEITLTAMIGAAADVGASNYSQGWNDYSTVGVIMTNISEAGRFRIFADGSKRSKSVTIENAKDVTLAEQVSSLYNITASTCKRAFGLRF